MSNVRLPSPVVSCDKTRDTLLPLITYNKLIYLNETYGNNEIIIGTFYVSLNIDHQRFELSNSHRGPIQ